MPPLNGLTYVVNVYLGITWAKTALTLLFTSMSTEHEPEPEQPASVHPLNTELGPASAVNVTTEFLSNRPLHFGPQSIPAGKLVILPDPLLVTVRTICWVKLAVTVLSASMVTVHEPEPEQAPVQPMKDQPLDGSNIGSIRVPYSWIVAPIGDIDPPPAGSTLVVSENS